MLGKDTKAYKNKLSYIRRYNKENLRTINFNVNKKTDSDVIEFVKGLENKSDFFKKMIRAEIAKKQK